MLSFCPHYPSENCHCLWLSYYEMERELSCPCLLLEGERLSVIAQGERSRGAAAGDIVDFFCLQLHNT